MLVATLISVQGIWSGVSLVLSGQRPPVARASPLLPRASSRRGPSAARCPGWRSLTEGSVASEYHHPAGPRALVCTALCLHQRALLTFSRARALSVLPSCFLGLREAPATERHCAGSSVPTRPQVGAVAVHGRLLCTRPPTPLLSLEREVHSGRQSGPRRASQPPSNPR